ncbi:MAG TPA: Rrf2 family transcriptional regulator [Candidatus Dormibacteraeota bacterium]
MAVGISAKHAAPASPALAPIPLAAPGAASFSMRVSSKAHYGLRMMTELARSYGQRPLSIAEVARTEHLPVAYLEQLAAQLRRGGLVQSTRGVHGGYSLARAPEKISVLDVVRVVEGEVAPVECVSADYIAGSCLREADCASRGIWHKLKEMIDGVLSQTTLADLIADQSLMAQMAPGSNPTRSREFAGTPGMTPA